MTLQPSEQVLIDGSRRELLEFGSCEHCVVVDSDDDAESILADVRRMLPKGSLSYRRVEDQTWELQVNGSLRTLVVSDDAHTEVLLRSVNRALLPDYEMRIFTPTMGSGYSLLLRPAAWWSEFFATHGRQARKLFVTTDERVEVTGTDPSAQSHPKSWWKKVFGS